MYSDYHKACLTRLMREEDATGMFLFQQHISLDEYTSLFNSFEKGSKMTSKALMNELVVQGREILENWQTAIQDDLGTIPDMLAELSEDEVEIVLGWCDAETEQEVRSYESDD